MATNKRIIKDTDHELVVLRVTSYDEKGRPATAIIGYDDTTFRIDDPAQENVFLTAWVQSDSVKPNPKKGKH